MTGIPVRHTFFLVAAVEEIERQNHEGGSDSRR